MCQLTEEIEQETYYRQYRGQASAKVTNGDRQLGFYKVQLLKAQKLILMLLRQLIAVPASNW